jgi:transcriptional regulator with XRE-family HTH domain
MQMKGSELRVKRVSAGISGAILCFKAGLGRSRLSGIERGIISMAPAEAARIETALNELTHAKRKADEVAMSLGWPTKSDQAASGEAPSAVAAL